MKKKLLTLLMCLTLLVGCGTSSTTSSNSTEDEIKTETEDSDIEVESSTDEHNCKVSMAKYVPSEESAPSNLYSIYAYSTFNEESSVSMTNSDGDIISVTLDNELATALEACPVQLYIEPIVDEVYPDDSGDVDTTDSTSDVKKLISYILYDAQYNRLGELTVEELVEYANDALCELQDKMNNTELTSSDNNTLQISSIEQDKYYVIDDLFTLVNDTDNIVRVCNVMYNDAFKTYDFSEDFIFPEVWGTVSREDTGDAPYISIGSYTNYYYSDKTDEPTVSPNLCLFWIDEATLDEATLEARNSTVTVATDNGSEEMNSEILNVSDISRVTSITGFKFIYNNTESSAILTSSYADSITIEPGDTIAINWSALGTVSIEE
jgi:hypothetical protein